MMKLTKKEIEVCNDFILRIKEYCDKQEAFYYQIAQNGDHSEDFVNRMTDMATSFHSVCQFIEICANNVFAEMQSSESLGDPNEMLGQVEPTATENIVANDKDVNN